MVECLYASLFPKLDKFIVLLQVVLLSKLGRKAQGLAEIPEPLRALSTKQDIQVSSDPYGKSSLGID